MPDICCKQSGSRHYARISIFIVACLSCGIALCLVIACFIIVGYLIRLILSVFVLYNILICQLITAISALVHLILPSIPFAPASFAALFGMRLINALKGQILQLFIHELIIYRLTTYVLLCNNLLKWPISST